MEALPEPEALLEHVSLLHARVEVGLTGDALERLAAIAALRDRLAETPPLGTFPGWQDALDAAVAEVCTTWLWRGVLAPA